MLVGGRCRAARSSRYNFSVSADGPMPSSPSSTSRHVSYACSAPARSPAPASARTSRRWLASSSGWIATSARAASIAASHRCCAIAASASIPSASLCTSTTRCRARTTSSESSPGSNGPRKPLRGFCQRLRGACVALRERFTRLLRRCQRLHGNPQRPRAAARTGRHPRRTSRCLLRPRHGRTWIAGGSRARRAPFPMYAAGRRSRSPPECVAVDPVTTRQHQQRQEHPSLPRPELGGGNVVIVDRDARRPEHSDRHSPGRPSRGGCVARRSHGDRSADREIARMAGSRSFAGRLRDDEPRLQPVRVAFACHAADPCVEFAALRTAPSRRTLGPLIRESFGPLRSARTCDSPLPEAHGTVDRTSTERRMLGCTSRSRSCSDWESSAQSSSAGCCT